MEPWRIWWWVEVTPLKIPRQLPAIGSCGQRVSIGSTKSRSVSGQCVSIGSTKNGFVWEVFGHYVSTGSIRSKLVMGQRMSIGSIKYKSESKVFSPGASNGSIKSISVPSPWTSPGSVPGQCVYIERFKKISVFGESVSNESAKSRSVSSQCAFL